MLFFLDTPDLSVDKILRDGLLQGSSKKPPAPQGKDSSLGSPEFKNRKNELQ